MGWGAFKEPWRTDQRVESWWGLGIGGGAEPTEFASLIRAMGVWLAGSAAGRPVDARFRTAAPIVSFILNVDRDGAAPWWRWL